MKEANDVLEEAYGVLEEDYGVLEEAFMLSGSSRSSFQLYRKPI